MPMWTPSRRCSDDQRSPIPTDTPEAALKAASKRVVVRVNPVDVYSWDHAKLGGRY